MVNIKFSLCSIVPDTLLIFRLFLDLKASLCYISKTGRSTVSQSDYLNGKIVPVLNYFIYTPSLRMAEWMYKSMYS
jgi:hypothetical protein